MNIKAGSKWVKDGDVVYVICERIWSFEHAENNLLNMVFYKCPNREHALTKKDFLEQYKPFKPVYEYQWASFAEAFNRWSMTYFYMTEQEAKKYEFHTKKVQRLDFTKRERT